MKKQMFKKMLSLTLASVLSVSILAGCGEQKQEESSATSDSAATSTEVSQTEVASSTTEEEPVELEPVTLKVYMRGGEKEGTKDVAEAFNAKLAEVLPNTTVEFTWVTSYGTNWSMFTAGGEEMDIAWCGYQTSVQQDIVDGVLLPLDDLIAEYAPNIQEEMSIWEDIYATSTYEGALYGIPCVQPNVKESQSFIIRKEFYEYMDIDAFIAELRSSKKLTSKMLDIMEDAVEAAIASGKYEVGKLDWAAPSGMYFALMGYLPLGNYNNIFFDPEAENPVPLHWYEIPEVKMSLERWAEWYDRGWYTETQILGKMPEGTRQTVAQNLWNWGSNWSSADENGIYFVDNSDPTKASYYVLCYEPEEGYVGASNIGSADSYTVIPYTAKNPERAMMLINLLHDEPGTVGNDLANMLAYGFEQNSAEAKKYGWFNYTAVEEDGQLKVDTSTRGEAPNMHSLYNWVVGNTFKLMHDGGTLTTTASKEYAMKYYTETYPKLKVTPLAGMVVDYSELTQELVDVENIRVEYDTDLSYGTCGAAGVDALYEEFMNKMNNAGLTRIKETLQAQIDAYIAK